MKTSFLFFKNDRKSKQENNVETAEVINQITVDTKPQKIFSAADLWNIQRRKRSCYVRYQCM